MHGAGRTSRPPGRLGSAVDGGADITQQCAMALGFSTTSLRTNVGNAASVCDRQHVPPSSLTFSWRTTPRTHPCSFHHSDTSQPTSTAAILPLQLPGARAQGGGRWEPVHTLHSRPPRELVPSASASSPRLRRLRNGWGQQSIAAGGFASHSSEGAASHRRRCRALMAHACTCWARGDTILIL